MELFWLPTVAEWDAALRVVGEMSAKEAAPHLRRLANANIGFIETLKLDRVASHFGNALQPYLHRTKPVRVALFGSSTVSHLAASIRVAGLRRGFQAVVFEGAYGMYRQDLAEPSAELRDFQPEVVLLCLDAHHVIAAAEGSPSDAIALMKSCWSLARQRFGATVIQQTLLPVFAPLIGNNEHVLPQSPARIVAEVNHSLRTAATQQGIHLLAVDSLCQRYGVDKFFDRSLWNRSKQEIHPSASPMWGDHVGRIIAAWRGLASKCLVLDLDNTLWGGTVGDDGVTGIRLGNGDPIGEAYLAFQRYVCQLAERGIILAVCSKNEDSVARAVFESHPEMLVRLGKIACFVANWEDKATNLRTIASRLNIAEDALAFVDDNPFERNLIRRELPDVVVPEMPEEPSDYIDTLAQSGCCEALDVTQEDLQRGQLYVDNAARVRLQETATDMDSYLSCLGMRLVWSGFERSSVARLVQLINRSNQFNVTTRRYSEEQVTRMIGDPQISSFQFRLLDRFGDNGIISVVIGRQEQNGTLYLDTWLMSCRVLGRQVEEAVLNVIVAHAHSNKVDRIVGKFVPTPKNGLVKDLYRRLGFTQLSLDGDGVSEWELKLAGFSPRRTHINIMEMDNGQLRDVRAAQ